MQLLDHKIHAAEALIRDLKQRRAVVEAKVLKMFEDTDINGVRLKNGALASVREASFPSIKDRRKFEQYVIKKKAFDLFQNRISSKAYFDRLEAGESVPGVSVFRRSKISINKGKGA
jgi:hypothetical protein